MASIGEIDLVQIVSYASEMNSELLLATIIIMAMTIIISALRKFHIEFADRCRLEDARKFVEISGNSTDDELTSELEQLITRLWLDRGVQVCL